MWPQRSGMPGYGHPYVIHAAGLAQVQENIHEATRILNQADHHKLFQAAQQQQQQQQAAQIASQVVNLTNNHQQQAAQQAAQQQQQQRESVQLAHEQQQQQHYQQQQQQQQQQQAAAAHVRPASPAHNLTAQDALAQAAQLELGQNPNALAIRRPFDPTAHDLEANFRLTRFADLKGRGCKVPQDVLLKLLEGLQDDQGQDEHNNHFMHVPIPRIGIGMDASITPLRHSGLSLVQTTDFFYPLVDDPYMQGRIACANVVSDLYAMGVVNCHNMLMLLAISKEMSEKERDVVVPLMMKGFQDTAREAGCLVTGGQTVVNPWVIIGGVASTVTSQGDVIMPEGASPGDVLVLTKALGTQVAVNAHQWLEIPERWEKVKAVTTESEVKAAYQAATLSMARLNLTGAKLMHKYGAGAATDVTGFGILGHAENLAKNQVKSVTFKIHTLPILANMVKIAKSVGNVFKLLQGFSAETSGGLLLTISKENAEKFCKEIEEIEGEPAWIIGTVEEGDRTAVIVDNPNVIEVE